MNFGTVLVLVTILTTCFACYPRCPCCYEETHVMSAYNCDMPETQPDGCVDEITECEMCTCCAEITIGDLTVFQVIQHLCVDVPPECTAITTDMCLDGNCPCCLDDPIPHQEMYSCDSLPPADCSTDPADLEDCDCLCYTCDGFDAIPTTYICGDGIDLEDKCEAFDPAQCLPQDAQNPPGTSQGQGGGLLDSQVPKASSALPNTAGQQIGLLQVPDFECDDRLAASTFCSDNGGVPMTRFELAVTGITNIPDCTVKAMRTEGVEWERPLTDFQVGTEGLGLYNIGCSCFDENNEMHGIMTEVCVECTEDVYFFDGSCVDPGSNCDAKDSCHECNDAGCCWHSDCTCRNYCSIIPPFALPFCDPDPAETCCEEPSLDTTDPCSVHHGDCEACERADCCYHTDCSCRNQCIWEPPFLYSFGPGECKYDPEDTCCEDEKCGILRSDGTYIAKDSVTLSKPRITPTKTGHIQSGDMSYTCLSQDCDDYCEPSVSVGVVGKEVVSATLECVCCGCDGDSDMNCCEEGKNDFGEIECPQNVPGECGASLSSAAEYTDCYCCALAQYDYEHGHCVCHDCICGGPEFPGGCHQSYLDCCGPKGCSMEADMRFKGNHDLGRSRGSSAADCCAQCQLNETGNPDVKCDHWNYDSNAGWCHFFSAEHTNGKKAAVGFYSSDWY